MVCSSYRVRHDDLRRGVEYEEVRSIIFCIPFFDGVIRRDFP